MSFAPALQVQAPSPPAPPSTPAPGGPAPTPAPTSDVGVISVLPRTAAELAALRAQRSELSSQLNSAARRREELVGDLDGATGANRAGIESRIRLLDERILQIEADIASTGKLLATARGQATLQPPPPPARPDMREEIVIPVMGMLSVFVFFPIAIAYARSIWRRGGAQKVESTLERDNAERLARLESAVDSIAIEMERVSEGQRFVTRLLAETQGREKVKLDAPRS